MIEATYTAEAAFQRNVGNAFVGILKKRYRIFHTVTVDGVGKIYSVTVVKKSGKIMIFIAEMSGKVGKSDIFLEMPFNVIKHIRNDLVIAAFSFFKGDLFEILITNGIQTSLFQHG